jgi:hypothetical protein
MDNTESTIADLTFLGLMYHTHFGFRNNQSDSPGWTSLTVQFNDQNTKLFINAFMRGNNVYTENDTENPIESFDELVDDEVYVILYDTIYLEQKAKTILPYSKVVIKYEKDTWTEKPDQWYNKKSKFFVHNKRSEWNLQDVLPFLNTRPNITVKNPFMEVEVESNGFFITYDDILFATRALAADETRTYNGFRALYEDKNILTLTVDMDNYSS